MNVLMLTNTYLPHVGGVARSVSTLAEGLVAQGHEVLIAAPEFPDDNQSDPAPHGPRVLRVPALRHVAGSDFSMPLLMPRAVTEAVDAFRPDIVHTHHPFLLGHKALRVSAEHGVPVIFTYHTRYDLYGHHVARDSERLRRGILSLAHGYCDLCHHVIAPSASMADHLRAAGVETPISVTPTGIDVARFGAGSRARARMRWRINDGAFVVGHVGRLSAEKNLDVLTEALCRVLYARDEAVVLIVGEGPRRPAMEAAFQNAGVSERVRFTGVLTGADLIDAYAAQDVFAFSSRSETQGMVLIEAMAAGVPVVALDAPGARDVVRDGENGSLLGEGASAAALGDRLAGYCDLDEMARTAVREVAQSTAAAFSCDRTVHQVSALYEEVRGSGAIKPEDSTMWLSAWRRLACDVEIVAHVFDAVSHAVLAGEGRADHPR